MPVHGKEGVVKVGTNAIASVTKFSLNSTVETADSTAMGNDWQSHLAGIPEWSGSVDAHFDATDTLGQGALEVGASVTLGLYAGGDGTGKKYYSGTATVTSRGVDVDMGNTVKVSFAFKGNGALTTATVS